jgi:hypothetical protein
MAMNKGVPAQAGDHGGAALSLMEEALALLDRGDVAPDVGAHLDLAICRLRDILGIETGRGPGQAETPGRPLNPERPGADAGSS